VRHIDFVDPVEEEWSKFQKEINDEVTVSVAIQEEDQDEATAERQLGEIEEQMLKWGRVLELEQKKEIILQRMQASRQSRPTEEIQSSSDEDELEIDKFFDWRSKAT
jgi:zinc finger protein 830